MHKADYECDFLVLGGGAAGLAGALAARRAGLAVLLVEKEAYLGGATAMSGGTLWLPANHVLSHDPDSQNEAARYLESLVKPVPDQIDRERIAAFVEDSPDVARLLDEEGLELRHARGWPDYYAELPGGKMQGRTLYCEAFDVAQLGDAAGWLPPSALFSSAHSVEVSQLALGLRSAKAISTAIRVGLRSMCARLLGRQIRTRGQALIGRLLLGARRAGAVIWLQSPLKELMIEDDRVTGAILQREGKPVRVVARCGVLIASGGFARDGGLRAKYQAPVGIDATMAPPGDTGDGIRAAATLGAAIGMMDQAWWVPGTKTPSGPMLHVWDRCFPHSMVVDTRGERYMDEAGPYMEVGQHMIRRHAQLGTDHSWLILESRHRRRYAFGMAPPMIIPDGWIEQGYLIQARSLSQLAERMSVSQDKLEASISAFNRSARTGVDTDQKRGSKAISRYYGDRRVRPNPNLGPIERPPFYAVRLYPGDVGTAGGIRTDEHGRALNAALAPIDGLYAAGNAAKGVFGAWYPGAGASIAPAIVFGMRAARHAAGRGV